MKYKLISYAQAVSVKISKGNPFNVDGCDQLDHCLYSQISHCCFVTPPSLKNVPNQINDS